MPDYNISRLGDGVADGVLECDLVTLSGDYIATVARNHNGYLEEAMWRLEASGSLTLMNSIASDSVAGVAATTPDNELIVAAAYTTHNDHLHTYSWVGIDFQGEATGIKTFHNPSITSFSRNIPFPQPVTPPPPGGGPVSSVGARGYLVVTACSSETFELTITAWMAFWGQSPFMGMGEMTSWKHGNARSPAIAAAATADDSDGNMMSADVMVAFQDANNNLKLGTWRVHVAPGQNSSIEKIKETSTTEAIAEVAVATYQYAGAWFLATAVITAGGNLKVIGWSWNPDGSFTRLADLQAGAANAVHCEPVRDNAIVTAVRNGSGHLELIYWEMPESPSGQVLRKGSVQADSLGTNGSIAVRQRPGGASPSDLGETIAAGSNQAGNLKVIRWKVTRTTFSQAGQVLEAVGKG
jgi:hypothetical protein